jgi:hypothetical protein
MNVITKAWCRFTGWDAEDFAVFNKKLYFCDGTVVFKAWDGTSDNTSNIIFYAKQAFQDFGNPNPKQCKLFMPIMIVNGILTYSTAVDVDFEDTNMTSTTTFTPGGTSLWGTALWGSSTWGSASILVKNWTSPASWEGRWLSGKLKIEENSITAKWMGTSMIYEWGASLG